MKGNESSTSLVHLARNSKSHEESIQKSRGLFGYKIVDQYPSILQEYFGLWYIL